SPATPSSLPVTPEATRSSPVHPATFPLSPQAQFARTKWSKKGIEERLAAEIPIAREGSLDVAAVRESSSKHALCWAVRAGARVRTPKAPHRIAQAFARLRG